MTEEEKKRLRNQLILNAVGKIIIKIIIVLCIAIWLPFAICVECSKPSKNCNK